MYRLLIADDEALEREGLELIIERMLPGVFQFAHAENGRRAIELADEFRPHIVMMDINMPGIQGLQAIREMKTLLPDSKFVLVTAYDFFAYAKEAVSLGVKEYIVKPAGREQISATLRGLLDELEAEKNRRAEDLRLRDKLSQLLPLAENELALVFMVDQVADAGEEQLADWLGFPLDAGCALVVAFPKQAAATATDKKKLYESIRSYAKAYGIPCIVSSLIDMHMAVFLHKEAVDEPAAWKQSVRQFGEKLCELAERQFQMAVAVGIGSLHTGADGLRKSYFEAVFASDDDRLIGKASDFEQLIGETDPVRIGAPESANEAERIIAKREEMNEHNADNRSYVLAALRRIREQREQQTLSVMDKAKRFIEERFTEELSLEDAADYVHLNAHYFSKVFKQQTGATFIDYVTSLRIDKAKQLIASADELALKEVCFEVGYKDPNYFSRVFKRVTGVTPTEFRNGSKN
ncbi:helix-turn-helix domain-containing protein [Paenibacillus sp. NEAU-GSW1]|uniref:AraC family transcriptional regulator n=1 Tax=Paenibacillus sp. NEAU-GSW1 TaxID=2682486 RepID=UPI0012E24C77|nr:helix-turn-helix domain-containing protein [Paenibacillus sp. NEAU-GSW1]MUT67218.1 AraC family transcriptional regulator [Paenibacillus sp. NEAU-GSW1]